MKSGKQCVPCFLRQVITTSEKSNADEKLQLTALKRAVDIVENLPLEKSPTLNVYGLLKTVCGILGSEDPYSEEKKKYNKLSMDMYPELCDIVKNSKDPLHTAIKVAVAGNIIDLGIGKSFNIKETLDRILDEGFEIDNYKEFKKELKKAKHLMYLADNAGEIVFDRVLIEILKEYCEVTLVVNEGPILNDVTLEDAVSTGLDKITKVITSGTDSIGKPPELGSVKYREAFDSADVFIAKGHGNFESMDQTNHNIFFLLQAKCVVVADSLGIKKGRAVFLHNPNFRQ